MRGVWARCWLAVGDPWVTELTVWRFEGARTAEDEALPRLERRAAAGDITVDDAALVSWPITSRKPSTRGLGSLADFGIDDDFIKRVREMVTPGTSAIFLLVDGTHAARLVADLGGVAVVRCELSGAQERRLLATLGEESADVRTR